MYPVVISKTSKIKCPVSMLQNNLLAAKISTDNTDFIFRPLSFANHLILTNFVKENISYNTARVLLELGLDTKRFGLHNLRSGGATTAVAAKTIPVKSVPLLILEDTCSQETCKSEQAYLSQTSDSFICNSLRQDALNRLLSFSENGNGEKCTTTCTKEARIIVFKCPEDSFTREFSTSTAVMSMSS
ncbi:unnamed protein product [Mytilus coruscus]|uniref:Tyr recombinase domain-containing protein n=1 Tax=Mytilus coruscus TaxID=42192 RepID=A0A6J8BQ65_MYTCO|nr:unnamed protein product [Mytilus coruscus]